MNNKKNASCRRATKRISLQGVMALTNYEELVTVKPHDINSSGLSFIAQNKNGAVNSELTMDVLVLETTTDNDFFFNHVKARIKSVQNITEPQTQQDGWRYGVEFIDLSFVNKNQLARYLGKSKQQNSQQKAPLFKRKNFYKLNKPTNQLFSDQNL